MPGTENTWFEKPLLLIWRAPNSSGRSDILQRTQRQGCKAPGPGPGFLLRKLLSFISPPALTPLLPLHPEVNERAEERHRHLNSRYEAEKSRLRGGGKGRPRPSPPQGAGHCRLGRHKPERVSRKDSKGQPSVAPSFHCLPQVHGLTSRALHRTLKLLAYAGCCSTSATPIRLSDAGELGKQTNQSWGCWRVRSTGAKLQEQPAWWVPPGFCLQARLLPQQLWSGTWSLAIIIYRVQGGLSYKCLISGGGG